MLENQKKPNFLIIGAPRAGTTWIDKNIRCHPEIYLPPKKEVHFFDNNYEKGVDYYMSNFDGVSNEKAIGEITPSYLHRDQIAEKIYRTLGDIKLIMCLRNPTERLYSRYWNAKSKFAENKNLSFEEKINSKEEFIQEGLYFTHIEKYLKLFSKENILILLYDDLKNDPELFLKSIYNFLEVDAEFKAPLMNNKINSASSKKLLGKSIILNYLSRGLRKAKLYQISQKIEDVNSVKLPQMKYETKKWLTEEVYYESNKKLEGMIGKTLDSWNK
ncbi:sulfotransferase domain-containing protein [Chondrinema litorale]|uniref:sulfotransferase domain-containing protein n=1 Tax=Chondrinema litorale TaxID=2994555 RepID=UPI002543DC87|nr:sulfotransferase domain-containing protein [Chondrinema litorale]UZS00179.1 sulfotransferase domain-containing protein [Chondrinema litorale]